MKKKTYTMPDVMVIDSELSTFICLSIPDPKIPIIEDPSEDEEPEPDEDGTIWAD